MKNSTHATTTLSSYYYLLKTNIHSADKLVPCIRHATSCKFGMRVAQTILVPSGAVACEQVNQAGAQRQQTEQPK